MPIDEDVLQDKIIEYSTKADDCQILYQKYMAVISNLRGIERTKIGEDPDTNEPIMNEPDDRGTGKKMNPARRQEVYDENVAIGDALP